MSEDFSTKMQDRLWQEVDDLKAKLAQAEKERDEALASYDKEQRINARYMAEHVRVEKERDAAWKVAAVLREWGATWRDIAWGYEAVEDVQIFDNKQQLWASCRPRDCMGRRVDE